MLRRDCPDTSTLDDAKPPASPELVTSSSRTSAFLARTRPPITKKPPPTPPARECATLRRDALTTTLPAARSPPPWLEAEVLVTSMMEPSSTLKFSSQKKPPPFSACAPEMRTVELRTSAPFAQKPPPFPSTAVALRRSRELSDTRSSDTTKPPGFFRVVAFSMLTWWNEVNCKKLVVRRCFPARKPLMKPSALSFQTLLLCRAPTSAPIFGLTKDRCSEGERERESEKKKKREREKREREREKTKKKHIQT